MREDQQYGQQAAKIRSLEAERSVLGAMLAAGLRERRRRRIGLAGVEAARVEDMLGVLERMTRTPRLRPTGGGLTEDAVSPQ